MLYELATGQTWPMNNGPAPLFTAVPQTPHQPTNLEESPCFTQILGVNCTPEHRDTGDASVGQQDILRYESQEI
ncbi:MAG: hypothetical protein ACKPHU_22720, partial [Planctomycetaceae bacterium]